MARHAKTRGGRLAATAALLLAAATPPAAANGMVGARAAARALPAQARPYDAGPAATAVHHHESAGGARLVFDMNDTVDVRAFVLSNPDRVVVDLKETAFLIDPANGRASRPARAGLIASYRFGHFAPGRSRIVVDLNGPARIARAASERTESGGAARLTLELAPSDGESFRAAARAARAAELLQAPPQPPRKQAEAPAPASGGRPVVALDPGHGGVDTGAAGKDAIEKNIVFEFARAVAAKLEASGRVKPVLTRAGDVFVPLADRVKLAQSAGAGLFVSIHADTLSETWVRGATVYTLSDRASDAEAARLAASENAADRAGGVTETEDTTDVQDILSDLTRRETRAMSHAYARSLVAYWKHTGDLNKNPLRSAGFRVLKAMDTPSVLLELGYMSSQGDLARLVSADWRERASTSVAQSIERFFAERTAAEAPAGAPDRFANAGAPAPR